jgi:uncharacterized protein
MRKVLMPLVCLAALVFFVRAEQTPATMPASAPSSMPMNMEKHTLVMLVLADNPPTLDKQASAELQARHLAHIQKMGATGKVLVAGPFANRDDEKLRGLLVFSCSIDEARAMANQDPAVQTGRLKVVCMSWMTEKGYLAFPKSGQ